MSKTVYAWHFTNGNKLRDGSDVPDVGSKLVFMDKPILCGQGFHASILPHEALTYAPGDTLHLVLCGGKIIHGEDKLVCTERTIIASLNASEMLLYFARMCALSVLHNAPKTMADIVEDWLMTGDEKHRSGAAFSAANSAARSAASSGANYAAYYAASSAAYSAAYSAASYAAHYAARSAANSGANYAASPAASPAAYSAACSKLNKMFDELVYECFEGPMHNVGFKGN